jgi:putative MATE family efflux protein
MVDTIFVGRVVGGNGIGALVVIFPIQRIIVALSLMIAIGSSTALARSNGEKDYEMSGKIIKNGFTLSFLIMIPMTLLTYIFRDQILLMLGTSKNILPYAHDYLSLVIFGSTFLCLTIFISNIMIALGNRKVSLISTSIGAILNIIIDYILVVKMSMGVKGAAIATSVSQIVGFIYAYYYFRKIKKDFNISSGFQLNKGIWSSIVLVGFSAFIVEAEDGILMAVLNNLLLNHVGDTGIIVLGVISKVYMFMFITILGISSAMQPIAAYNLGAENYKRLRNIVRKTAIYSFITSTILWVGGLVFTEQLISIFVKEKDIILESVKAFRIMIAAFPLISIYYMSIYYFQALGKARKSFLVAIFRQLIIMLPLAIIMVKVLNLGAMGVWISYPISDVIASVTSYILIKDEGYKLDDKVKKQKEEEKINKSYVLD